MSEQHSNRAAIQILAAVAGTVPMTGVGIWMYIISDDPMTITTMLLGPMLVGGSLIFWLLFLHLYICRDSLDTLRLWGGGWGRDILIGCLLGGAQLLFHFSTRGVLSGLFPPRPPAEEIIELISRLGRNPVLLAVWLGPVVWIGVALFEELWRTFTLCRLWSVWTGPAGRWSVIAVVALLFGIAHGYQGPASVLSISIQSVVIGWVFMTTGRLRGLVIAHALYDSVQIIMAVIAVRQIS